MNTHQQTQTAIQMLSSAFAPFDCVIAAPSKKGFSFIIVNEFGVARHTQRLYREEYSCPTRLQSVIERARKTISA